MLQSTEKWTEQEVDYAMSQIGLLKAGYMPETIEEIRQRNIGQRKRHKFTGQDQGFSFMFLKQIGHGSFQCLVDEEIHFFECGKPVQQLFEELTDEGLINAV